MKNFDYFIGIDWSGAKSPIRTKSIAVSIAEQGNKAPKLISNLKSRQEVVDWIINLTKQKSRILIGIDCNFGYAATIAQKQFGPDIKAHELWSEVDLENKANSNFFAGGFWQKYASDFWTEGKKPIGFKMPQRQTEAICSENGYGHPESPFKLIGAKQVGKGGLAGMRVAHFLKEKLGPKIAIWPFEPHGNSAQIVMTEIYPRQFLMRAGFRTKKIRDINNLNNALFKLNSEPILLEYQINDHQTDALVSAAGLRYLCGMNFEIPKNISAPHVMNDNAKNIEGWIFGVGDRRES